MGAVHNELKWKRLCTLEMDASWIDTPEAMKHTKNASYESFQSMEQSTHSILGLISNYLRDTSELDVGASTNCCDDVGHRNSNP